MAYTAHNWADGDTITADLLNSLEAGVANEQVGPAGKDGADGATGKAGSDAKQIKSGTLNEDKDGTLTGATVTFSDDTTVEFTINKATA